MMFESVFLLAQAAATLFLAGWMFTGVKDNWLFPDLNRAIVAMIMRIEKFEEMYPEEFTQIRHRRVENARIHRAVFALIVIWETLACIMLSLGVAALGLALCGIVSVDLARAVALLGAVQFTSVWAGFLVFGNHWIYWYCHEWGQNTHFQLVLWGLGTMIFLSLPVG